MYIASMWPIELILPISFRIYMLQALPTYTWGVDVITIIVWLVLLVLLLVVIVPIRCTVPLLLFYSIASYRVIQRRLRLWLLTAFEYLAYTVGEWSSFLCLLPTPLSLLSLHSTAILFVCSSYQLYVSVVPIWHQRYNLYDRW